MRYLKDANYLIP